MLVRLLLMIPFVGQLLRTSWLLFWDGRVSPFPKIFPVIAAIYVISPIDLLRDYVLGIGQIDDVIVAGVALTLFVVLSPREIVSEHLHGRKPADDDKDAIETDYRFLDDDE